MKEVKLIEKQKIKKEEKEIIYNNINQTIKGWPEWKRKAYDENFAISQYAKKYSASK